MKTVSIFGSTGTIGLKTFSVAIDNKFDIISLVGNKNCERIVSQARLANPKYVCVVNDLAYDVVKSELRSYKIEVLPGSEIRNLAKEPVDCCVMAIAGNAGIIPTFSCLGYAKRLAIATKEAIISGGKLLLDLAGKKGTEIIPIDSEHNAIYQCLMGEKKEEVSKIILTASGGAFLDFEEKDLENVRIEDALKHPNWNMGKKITIDSSTLINKALEIIEAHYLFGIDIEKIEALIHPNSIIHGLINFRDGSIKSLMAYPDMTMPISFAMNYPIRQRCDIKPLDFQKIKKLEFREPKAWQKRNIDLAYFAVREKKAMALNFVNEKYVYEFLNGKIKFSEIYNKVFETIQQSDPEKIESLDDVIELYSRFSSID